MTLPRKAAHREIQSKSAAEIERETARKWAARAVASFKLGKVKQAWDYYHEALEHAATVADYGKFVGTIQREMDRIMKPSRKHGRY